MMRKLLFVTACITCLQHTVVAQQAINQHPVGTPESVTSDGRFYYVADIGAGMNPGDKDGNGAIRKLDLAGKNVGDSLWITGLNAPKGAVIANNILFVTDIDRVVGFDLKTGTKKLDIDCASVMTAFLNDIAVKDDHTLFVSAMDVNKILIIQLNPVPKVEELILADPLKGPNGLYYHHQQQRLYVCTFDPEVATGGQIGFIDLKAEKKQFTPVVQRPGLYDGMAVLPDGTLVVSDWVAFEKKGVLLTVNTTTKAITTINTTSPIAGPADFMVNQQQEIIIPAMLEGNIFKFKLPKRK